jgi:hypothetical protein
LEDHRFLKAAFVDNYQDFKLNDDSFELEDWFSEFDENCSISLDSKDNLSSSEHESEI